MSTQFTNRQWRLPNNENKDKQSNYSMDFDAGSSQYISTSASINGFTSFTISAWANAETLTTADTLVGQWRNSNSSNSAFLMYLVSNTMHFYIGSGSSAILAGGDTTLSTGQWYHFCATWDGTTTKLYINGVQESTTGSASSMNTTTVDLLIGAYNDNAGTGVQTSATWNGQIDAVSIYNYALSSSQITTLYGSSSTGIGNPMSLSPKPVFYAPLGDQDAFNGSNYLVPNSSLKDFVFDFNSSNQTSITVSNFNYTIYTASVWFKPNTNISTSTTQQYLLYFNTAYSPLKYILLGGGSDIISTTMGSGLTRYYSGSDIPANQWANVTISFNNGYQYSIFLNGADVTDTLAAALGSSSGLIIGERAVLPAGFDGEISNVLIWDTQALTATEIETLYNNGSPIKTLANIPQNSNLKGWWKLDASDTYDGTNWTIEDHAGSNDGTSSGMTQANLVQSDLSFTSGYSPYALEFDAASNDKITASSNSNFNTGDLSASIWINASNLGNNIKYFFGNSNALATAGFTFSVNTSTGNAWYIGRATTTHMYVINNVSINFTNNVWNHLCFSYDDTTKGFILYLNGASVNSGTATSNTKNASGSIIFGGHNVNYDLTGKLSNASIWNTALTSAQVTEIYNEGVPSNLNNHSAYSNLVSWWQLGSNSSFNTNWTVLDEKGSNNGTSSNMGEDAIVDGVGSYANGLSSGMGGDEVIGDAPYSTANALSVNMDVEDRVTDTPS